MLFACAFSRLCMRIVLASAFACVLRQHALCIYVRLRALVRALGAHFACLRALLRSLEYAFACDFASAFVCVFAFACVHLCMRFYVIACAFACVRACVCACAGLSFVCVFACACLRSYMRLYATFRVLVYAFVCAFCVHLRVLRSHLQMSMHARAWTRRCMFLCALCMQVCIRLPTPLHARVIRFCACLYDARVLICVICFYVPLYPRFHALVSVFACACA